ncbi:hypothetical protein NQ318_002256 [Aromia moschata]|uniref:Mos1 transposase HTH domain-containing protein n=1 Tax=Aromia moschata TaxID=1265417 RepID=A0AAV8Z5G3_9CUCU|nr:hypothetical protein NQ318_002256 [Aromia moschata]
MQRSLEQRFAIKICVKLGKIATETVSMIKTAYKEDALSDRQVFRWHKAFLDGREEVDVEDRAGRPSTTTTADNVTRVGELLNSDRRLSLPSDLSSAVGRQFLGMTRNRVGSVTKRVGRQWPPQSQFPVRNNSGLFVRDQTERCDGGFSHSAPWSL